MLLTAWATISRVRSRPGGEASALVVDRARHKARLGYRILLGAATAAAAMTDEVAVREASSREPARRAVEVADSIFSECFEPNWLQRQAKVKAIGKPRQLEIRDKWRSGNQ